MHLPYAEGGGTNHFTRLTRDIQTKDQTRYLPTEVYLMAQDARLQATVYSLGLDGCFYSLEFLH